MKRERRNPTRAEWAAQEKILKNAAIIEERLGLDPMVLERLEDALGHARTPEDDEAYERWAVVYGDFVEAVREALGRPEETEEGEGAIPIE